MAGVTKTRWAVRLSIKQLLADGAWAYLWTLTTPDKVELSVLGSRWNQFRRWLQRAGNHCVRVFERHPGGHGWHVHFVTAEWLSVDDVRPKAEAAGFGRINARRVPSARAGYIAKYVGKDFGGDERLRGARMWACVGFAGTSAKDVTITWSTLWGHWVNDHWELKAWPPHLDETRWAFGPDGRMRMERIWMPPPLTPELRRKQRSCDVGSCSEQLLKSMGWKKFDPPVPTASLPVPTRLYGYLANKILGGASQPVASSRNEL